VDGHYLRRIRQEATKPTTSPGESEPETVRFLTRRWGLVFVLSHYGAGLAAVEGEGGGTRGEGRQTMDDKLAALRPAGYSVTMNAGETLERFETSWSAANALKKKLLRSAVAAVLIRGKLIRAVQLREAFYPFVLYRNGRNSGSDGIRTRDLRLDRPTCSPLHYAPKCATEYTTTPTVRQIPAWHSLPALLPTPSPPGTQDPALPFGISNHHPSAPHRTAFCCHL
jgi:hypothetical protein